MKELDLADFRMLMDQLLKELEAARANSPVFQQGPQDDVYFSELPKEDGVMCGVESAAEKEECRSARILVRDAVFRQKVTPSGEVNVGKNGDDIWEGKLYPGEYPVALEHLYASKERISVTGQREAMFTLMRVEKAQE